MKLVRAPWCKAPLTALPMPSGLVKHRDHLNVLGCLAAIAAKHWRSTVAVLANKNLFVQCNVIISMGYALICVNLSHGSHHFLVIVAIPPNPRQHRGTQFRDLEVAASLRQEEVCQPQP